MKSKPLSQLVPDFKAALEEGLQEAAEQVVYDLKREGPYYTGFFETLWEVQPGKTKIVANIANPLKVPKTPAARSYTTAEVPESPNLGGYTIGNRSEYRLYAQDILKGGARSAEGARLTAPKDWFDTYFNAKMPAVLDRKITNVFRRF
jgi:hypothetical protein